MHGGHSRDDLEMLQRARICWCLSEPAALLLDRKGRDAGLSYIVRTKTEGCGHWCMYLIK